MFGLNNIASQAPPPPSPLALPPTNTQPLFEGLAPITGSLEDHAHTIGVTMYDASHLLRMRELGHTEVGSWDLGGGGERELNRSLLLLL